MPPNDPVPDRRGAPDRGPSGDTERRLLPKLVGRGDELRIIREAFSTALKGRGSIIFIEGEIGIGKTRLLSEAENVAREVGLRALSASCIGGAMPLMPFLNALESARKQTSMPEVDVQATIEEVFYIHSDGRLILHDTQRLRPDQGDTELRALLAEIRKTKRAGLKGLFIGDRKIIIEPGAITVLAAVIRGDETPKMRQQMKYLLATVEDKFGATLMDWKGHQADIRGLRDNLRALLLGDYGRPEALKMDFEVTSPTVFEDIVRFLLASSSQLPIALLFDDLHWMDLVSMEMLSFLAERIDQGRVVIIGTYRPEGLSREQSAPDRPISTPAGKRNIKNLLELLGALRDMKGFLHLKLRHLSRDELVEMINSVYPEGGLGDTTYDFLFRHGEGNPFYTEEILRSLGSSGKLQRTDKGWRALDLSEMDVPVTIREAVLVRMGGLDKREREVLQHAAVIGREWDVRVLEKIMKDPAGLPQVLEALDGYNLIVKAGEGRYRFEHDVVRETAYDDISEALRKLYHRKVGEAYEALAGIDADGKPTSGQVPDDILMNLAQHFSRSKVKEKSLKYNMLAANLAQKAHDNRLARTLLMTALESAKGIKGREEVKTALFDIARIQELEGDWDQAIKDYEELISYLGTGEEVAKARVFIKMARIYEWRNEWDVALSFLEKAQVLIQGSDDKLVKVQALVQHGRVLRRLGNYDPALAKAEEAIALLGDISTQDRDTKDVWLEAMKERGGVLIWKGRADETIQVLQQARKVCAEIGNDAMMASLLQNEGFANQAKGDLPQAVELYLQAIEAAKKVGNARTMAYAYANMAEAYIAMKRYDDAAGAVRRSLEIFYKAQDRLSIAHTHMVFGSLLTEKGDLDDAMAHFNMAMELALEVKESTILSQIYHNFGKFYAKKGDPAMARKLYRKAIALNTETGRKAFVDIVRKDLDALERGRKGLVGRVSVGRKTEIIKLLQAFKEVDRGHGRVVVVEGNTGTGKSKVLDQFINITKPQRCTVLVARCTPRESQVPYASFIEALEMVFSKELSEEALEGIRSVVADNPREMLKLFPILGTIPSIAKLAAGASDARSALSSIQKEQDRLFENITRIILSLAQGSTVLLVLEDFHWADVSSIGLLHYLARSAQSSRLMILLAYSPDVLQVDSKTSPLTDTLRLMNRERLVTTIVLGNLNQKETSEMVSLMLDGRRLPPEVQERIFHETEGNPFFIEEVVLSLIEQGIIDLQDKENVVKRDIKAIELPKTVSQVMERKIHSMGDEERQVLRLAGIIGYKFDYDILRGISSMPEDKLVGILDDLVDKGLIIEDKAPGSSEEAFRFPFDHFRRLAMEGLMPSDRIKLHDKVARLLEKHERPEELAFDLAMHHREAGNLLDSARWAIIAGERAQRLASPELAEQQAREAVSILDQLPPSREVQTQRARALDLLAEICNKTGRYEEAEKHVIALNVIATSIGDARLKAIAHIATGRLNSGKAQFPKAKGSYMAALEIYEKLEDIPAIVNTRRFLSTILWREGSFGEAVSELQKCQEAAQKLGDQAVMGAVESALGNVYRDMGEYDKSITHFLKGIAILEKGLDQYELGTAYNNLGATYRYLGQWDEALQYFEKCIAVCKKINFPSIMAYGLKNKGEVLAKRGRIEDLDDAEKACDEAMAVFTKLSHAPGIANVHMNKGIIRRVRQDWAGAVECFEEAVRSGMSSGVPDLVADIEYEYALTLEAEGDAVSAREHVIKAIDIYERVKATKRMERAKELLNELGGAP